MKGPKKLIIDFDFKNSANSEHFLSNFRSKIIVTAAIYNLLIKYKTQFTGGFKKKTIFSILKI